MKSSFPKTKIKNDLSFCKSYWTVIYGSFVSDDFIPERSDIDVAVITQSNNKESNIEIWKSFWGKYPDIYDVKIFELLPLYLKIEILKRYEVLFGDELAISEYFYYFQKIWKDMEFRWRRNQFSNIKEMLALIERRKIII